ncbi:methyl-accepting chemotaxis protein [Lacibacterium aquatile]|uniref:Methyl-accepting chemotaxis protein n=1 Tax=Lacibacterium aquatile TaxID=1168082 RepID=A0ABW5DP71_9PROT
MRLTIKIKLAAAFGFVLLLLLITASVGLFKLSSTNDTVVHISDTVAERLQHALELQTRVVALTRTEKNLILADTPELTARFDGELLRLREELLAARAKLDALSSTEGRQRIAAFDSIWQQYIAVQDRVRALGSRDTQAEAKALQTREGMPLARQAVEALQQLAERLATGANVPTQIGLMRIIDRLQMVERDEINAILASEAVQRDAYIKHIDGQFSEARTFRDQIRPQLTAADQSVVDQAFERVGRWVAIQDRMFVLAREDSLHQAFILSAGQGRQILDQVQEKLNAVVELNSSQMEQAKHDAASDYRAALWLLISCVVISLIAAVSAATWISLSISRGLGKAGDLADAVALGDLDQEIKVTSNDEIKDLVDALNRMTGNLRKTAALADAIADGDLTVEPRPLSDKDTLGIALERMVEQLRTVVMDALSAAENVSAGSQELSASSEELSQGATEQASSAEEASASMEEMAANIKQNADNATQTERIARESAVNAQTSGDAVNRAVEAMQTIAEKITIVQEIARQTDLLALNAAVEAARAGEHGKGFAVVASEVRKLAERSQTAAAEINALSSQTVKVAKEAGDLLSDLVPNIQRTAELVEEISAACREQDIGGEQINQAIQQLDKVTQQNASASEQMSATSEELAAQAEQLQASIAFFRVESAAHRAAPIAQVPQVRAKPVRAGKKIGAKPVAAPSRIGRKANGKSNGNGFALDMTHGSGDGRDAEFERY